MSPIALRHAKLIPGIVLPWVLPPRELKMSVTPFWGVKGESAIIGGSAGRSLEIPVLVYDEEGRFDTRGKLSAFLDELDDDMLGKTATLTVESEAGRPLFRDATFTGGFIVEAPKIDEAGTLGGGAWAIVMFTFRQHR